MKKIIALFILLPQFLQTITAQDKFVDSMINWVNATHEIDSLYIVTLHKISYRLSEKDLKRSYEYFQKAAYYSDSIAFTYGKALAQINLGILYSNSENLNASNNAYFKAMDYAETCGSLRLQAISLNNMGENFKTLHDFAKCRQYTKKAIDINIKQKAWRGVAINYELLFECDLEEKLYGDAKKNLNNAMPFVTMADENYLRAQFYIGFGKLYAINNQTDSATFYFTKALDESKKEGDLRNEFNVYIAQTKYLKKNKPEQKIALFKKAIHVAKQAGYFEGVFEAAKEISFTYDEAKMKDSSLAYYRIYRSTSDSLFSDKNLRNVNTMETEWMIKKKEMENRQLKEFTTIQTKQITVKNTWLLVVIISLLLTISLAFIIYKSIVNNKKNTELELKQKISETEMAALKAQMNPHFMFNCINSIDAFIHSNDKYNATLYLNKFAKLLRNILDSSKENTVPITKDIETLKLYIELEELRNENKFKTTLNVAEEILNNDYKVPPLIIQPILENAILHGIKNKYENDGILTVDIKKVTDKIQYTVTDNGVGRNAAGKIMQNKESHYGMQISYDRIKLFNKEETASVQVIDLYNNEKATGTKVIVNLNII